MAGQTIDFTSVRTESGISTYLVELVEEVYSSAGLISHARQLSEIASIVRIHRAIRTADGRLTNSDDPRETITKLGEAIFDFGIDREQRTKTIGDITEDDFKKITGYRPNMADLNNILFPDGSMSIVAGRPSMGKTAFALRLALDAALQGIAVLVISIEMSFPEIVKRLIAMRHRIDLDDILSGKIGFDGIEKTLALPIIVADYGAVRPEEIRAIARKHITKHNVGLVVVDYLQLITTGKHENQYELTTHVSQSLRATAKDLNTPFIVVSQLSRNPESKKEGIPILSDLRGSGAIEQDAHIVIFPFRPGVYSGNRNDSSAKVIVAKNRNGPCGDFDFNWTGKYTLFEPVDKTHTAQR